MDDNEDEEEHRGACADGTDEHVTKNAIMSLAPPSLIAPISWPRGASVPHGRR